MKSGMGVIGGRRGGDDSVLREGDDVVEGSTKHREADSGVAPVRWKLGAVAPPWWKLLAVTMMTKDKATMEEKATVVHRQISAT
jgi:hypothetical protein